MRLRLGGGQEEPVTALRAFPLTHPFQFVVLRREGGEEVGLVAEADELDPDSSRALRAYLEDHYFLPRIVTIHKVTERFGTSVWDLETSSGRIEVTTRPLNEAVQEISSGHYVLTAVDENRYEIPDLGALDPVSQARFLGLG